MMAVRGGADGGGCFPTGRHYPGIAHLLRIVAAGLADEWAGELQVREMTFVAIDTETTGRDPENDRIVEIGCIVWKNGEVAARHTWLVNPGCPIPQEASEVHGISDADVRDKPAFGDICPHLFEVLQGALPLAYNATFDKDFLLAELRRAQASVASLPPAARKDVEWVDPLVWARELYREAKSKSLGDMCERLGIALEKAHRADHDAEAAMRVLWAMGTDARVPQTYAGFIQEQRRLSAMFDEERARWRFKPN